MVAVLSYRCQYQSLLETMLKGSAELVYNAVELVLVVIEIFRVSGSSTVSAAGTSRHLQRNPSTRMRYYKASR